jgi:hypothetical protein
MKKVSILFAALFLAATSSMAQEEVFRAKLKKEAIPAIVIESIALDFPEYTATGYFGLPVDIVDDVWYVTSAKEVDEDYDTYDIVLSGKNGIVRATYDSEGNLLSEHRVLKDAPLPHNI